MPIEYFLALRFMREGRAQTALILGGVAVGVAVMVFLSSLIDGLQASVIARTLGSQPHVVIQPNDELARPVMPRVQALLHRTSRVERPAQRVRSIAEWQRLLRRLRDEPGVEAATALVVGPALVVRAGTSSSVRVFGVEADAFDRVIPMRSFVVAGSYRPESGRVMLGRTLASQLGVGVGDRVRLETARGNTQMFLITAVFEVGNKSADEQWAIVSLREGQALLGLPGGASHLYLRVRELYEAESIAARMRAATGLWAESWMASNAQLLTALRSQSASNNMIQMLVVIAVAMGIASVLVVSVVQRSRAIGILRAMGVPRERVLRLFLFQGAVYGVLGALIGTALGMSLVLGFIRMASPLFPIEVSLRRVVLACAIALVTGVVSAVLPARRAAKLDPAVAIRNV